VAPIPEREVRRIERRDMVRRQIVARGVRTPAILRAFLRVPREVFVPGDLQDLAYRDQPVPIGLDQTISQPFVVALMIDALRLRSWNRVLEIGTGSGYTAALLACLVREVFSMERLGELAERAKARLDRLGLARVRIRTGDGTLGWPAEAPFDAIVVWAASPGIPRALEDQLAIGGRIVIPAGESREFQTLYRVTRVRDSEAHREVLDSVRFVPLVGEEGWP